MNEDQVRMRVRESIKQHVNGGLVVTESEEDQVNENMITGIIDKIIPNFLRKNNISVYVKGNETFIHAKKGSQHETAYTDDGRNIVHYPNISRKEAEEAVDSFIGDGFKKVPNGKEFLNTMLSMPQTAQG